MTDQGTADRIIVCGPDCKAVKLIEEQVKSERMSWRDRVIVGLLWLPVIALALVGALDIGLRAAINYWSF